MKYRALSPTGDYQMGRAGLMLTDTPQAVAQAVKTRLGLASGEWFLDIDEGTPYGTKVLGTHTQDTRDPVIKSRILDTPGVVELVNYYSTVNDRALSVTATVTTKYGVTPITVQA